MEVIYSFSVSETKDYIKFFNIHREVLSDLKKWTWSKTLKDIEKSIQKFSNKYNKPCHIIFSCKQKDVKNRLLKNNYEFIWENNESDINKTNEQKRKFFEKNINPDWSSS